MNSLPPPPAGSAPLPPPNATTADPLELTLSRKQTWLQRYWALPVVLALGVAAIVAILIADTTGKDKSATGTTSSVAEGDTIPTTPAVTNADTTVVTLPATTVAPVPETTVAEPATTAATETTVSTSSVPTSAPPTSAAPIAPLQLVGKLDGVVDVSGHTPSMMTITCNGSRAFIVTALDANGRTVDVLIDKVGKYSGTVAVLDPSVTSLQIESSGNWTIDVADLASAPRVSGANSGTGDGVFIRDDAAAGSVRVTHSGRGAFSVKTSTGAVVAEGTGAFDATVPVPGGPVVLVVRADGAWSIT
ncbi:MAG: hypothetical protein AB7V43_11785 [Acidimicrobiia bacterium]